MSNEQNNAVEVCPCSKCGGTGEAARPVPARDTAIGPYERAMQIQQTPQPAGEYPPSKVLPHPRQDAGICWTTEELLAIDQYARAYVDADRAARRSSKSAPSTERSAVLDALWAAANRLPAGPDLAAVTAAIQHIDGAAPTQAVPAGWKMVPVDLTSGMLKAAGNAWLEDPLRRTTTLYRAMLAAAPDAPVAPVAPARPGNAPLYDPQEGGAA